MGLQDIFDKMIPWKEEEFNILIPYAIKIRNRYTVFNKTDIISGSSSSVIKIVN